MMDLKLANFRGKQDKMWWGLSGALLHTRCVISGVGCFTEAGMFADKITRHSWLTYLQKLRKLWHIQVFFP